MNNQEVILGTENVPKLFLKYCIPAVVAMVITGMQSMIDGIFVGNFIGSNALASINISIPFYQLIIGVSMVISIGTQSYVGIYLGAGNKQKAIDCFHTYKIVLILSGALITTAGLILNKQIGLLLGADETLIFGTSTYIKTIACFAIPMCLMFYFGFLNRIVGKPERYFYGTIASIIINIGLDYLFIAKLNLGIMGAALATGIAFVAALVVVIGPMLKKNSVINIYEGRFSPKCIAPVLYNGSSEGINSISTAVTVFLFNTALMNLVGPGGVAAFTAISYIGSFGSMMLFGISDGIGPVISYNYGAGNKKRVREFMRISYICNFIFGIILFSVLFFAGKPIIELFIKDSPELVELAANGGKIYAFAFLISGFNILNSGYFTFIGKGLQSVMVAASRGLIFVSIGIFTLPHVLDINGIWLSVPFAEVCAVIVGIILLKFTKVEMKKEGSVLDYDEKM